MIKKLKYYAAAYADYSKERLLLKCIKFLRSKIPHSRMDVTAVHYLRTVFDEDDDKKAINSLFQDITFEMTKEELSYSKLFLLIQFHFNTQIDLPQEPDLQLNPQVEA
jgi:hypothetical protein